MKVVCFSKRITEIISSLYLFISKKGRTPLSPEPRSVARAQPCPRRRGLRTAPARLPPPGSPLSPHRHPRGHLSHQPAAGRQVTRGQRDEPPQGLRDESQVTPRAGGRVTRGAGGRTAPQPRATPDRPRSRG